MRSLPTQVFEQYQAFTAALDKAQRMLSGDDPDLDAVYIKAAEMTNLRSQHSRTVSLLGAIVADSDLDLIQHNEYLAAVEQMLAEEWQQAAYLTRMSIAARRQDFATVAAVLPLLEQSVARCKKFAEALVLFAPAGQEPIAKLLADGAAARSEAGLQITRSHLHQLGAL